MAEEILRTEGLCKRFGSLEVLRGVSISVFRQEIVSVIGPSGSGKSTFLRCLNWLERPTSGQIMLAGQDIASFFTNRKSQVKGWRFAGIDKKSE